MALSKKKPRRALPLLLLAAALLLALGIFVLCRLANRDAAVYADVTERDWFYPEVRHLAAANLLDADPKARFSPTEPMTRAMAVTLLYRLAGSPASEGTPFSDVAADDPCASAAAWAVETGISSGDEGLFRPDTPVTREQLACFLYRYAAQAGLDTLCRGALENYHDLACVSAYASEPVAWAAAYDLLDCRDGGALLPRGAVSRALGAVAFSRFLRELAGDVSYVPAEPSRRGQQRLWILMYHDIVPDGQPGGTWAITESQLRADLKWLTDHGYTFYLPEELAKGTRLARKSVMLTFDDGYVDSYRLAFPLLREYGAKAVIAPVVGKIEEDDPAFLSWEMCREMADSGCVEIGSHTFALHDETENGVRRLPGETQEAYAARVFPDLTNSIQIIEAQTGHRVYYLAYPNGVTDNYAAPFVAAHFAMSVVTRYGAADISESLHALPRLNIDSETRASVLGTLPKRLRLLAP